MRKNKIALLMIASLSVAFASAQTTWAAATTSTAWTKTPTAVTSWAKTAQPTTATTSKDSSSSDLDNLDLDNLDSDTSGSTSTTSNTSTNTNWFASWDVVITWDVKADAISLEVKAINDWAWKQYKRYKVSYSTKSLDESDPTEILSSTFEFDTITWSTVTLEVTGLDTATNGYFFVVEPMNKDNVAWPKSEQVEYSLSHGAADASWAAAQMSDFTYEYSGMNVSLKWSPVEWATKVEIFFKTEDQDDYTSIGTAKMSDGAYNFTLTKAGNSFVKLIPTDDNWAPVGAEIVKSLKVDATTVAPEVKKVPKVWPETDLMIAALLMASLGYGLFRFRKIA